MGDGWRVLLTPQISCQSQPFSFEILVLSQHTFRFGVITDVMVAAFLIAALNGHGEHRQEKSQ